MPAATTKAELLAVTQKEFAKLKALIWDLSARDAEVPDEDGASIKSVIGHRAHWIGLFLGWVADGRAGRPVHIPDKDVKWSDLKPYNAALRDRQAMISWEDTRSLFFEKHTQLEAMVGDMDDVALYGAPMPGQSKWTTGRYAEASGPSHCRSAAKFIRKRLKEIRN